MSVTSPQSKAQCSTIQYISIAPLLSCVTGACNTRYVMYTSYVLTKNLEGECVFHRLLILFLHDGVSSLAREDLPIFVSGRGED